MKTGTRKERTMPKETWRLDNFERIKQYILSHPEEINMMKWARKTTKSPCGSIGCIAGTCDWMMNVDGEKPASEFGFLFNKDGSINAKFLMKRTKESPYGNDWSGNYTESELYEADEKQRKTESAARDNGAVFLGIDEPESERLFLPHSWPGDYEDRLADSYTGTKTAADIIVERIDFFLNSGY